MDHAHSITSKINSAKFVKFIKKKKKMLITILKECLEIFHSLLVKLIVAFRPNISSSK